MNCRRIQSALSAYIDGELTGEEMLLIRRHLSDCEFCSDEYNSLQVVKKLLGSLETVDASNEWSSSLTAHAYAGGKPWWGRVKISDMVVFHSVKSVQVRTLTPRGVRLVRALALSTIFVFFAAVPLSSLEHLDQGVTGRLEASMVAPFLPWTANQKASSQVIGPIFQPQEDIRSMATDTGMLGPGSRYDISSASMSPSFVDSSWSPNNSLSFVSTTQK